jgi:uncharacterized protein YjiS (DUF1127 family)
MSIPITIDRRFRTGARRSGVRPWLTALAWLGNQRARGRLRRCAALDRRFVADIGLTPAELATLCAAPPWRPVVRARDAALTSLPRPAARSSRSPG